jgi:hypothetical protein
MHLDTRSLALALAATSLLAACGDSDDPAPPTAQVRVAHLSPGAPPVDVCIRPAGAAQFTGPVLKSLGVTAGLAYSQVTRHVDVPAAALTVRIVAPNAADCSASLAGLPDVGPLPALGAGTRTTVAATGLLDGTPAFGLQAFADEASAPAGQARLRFVHASPGTPAVDVGLGGGAAFAPVFEDVAFGAAGAPGAGYVSVPPLSGVEVSARATGSSSDVIAVKPVNLPAGAVATAFAIGELESVERPLRVLLCVDSAAPSGALAACTVVGGAPERARVRVAHLSPDAPAVDVCLRPSGPAAFAGPVLESLGAAAGLAYRQVTTWVELPTGAWDVRVVTADATSCATGAVPDTTGVVLPDDLVATVAATGLLGGTPAFGLTVLVDDVTPSDTQAKLRFVHASPGTPPVDVGTGAAGTFAAVFDAVAFRSIDATAGANGYATLGPVTGATLSARATGTTADALVLEGVTLPAGSITSVFAIGVLGATPPLQALVCADDAPAAGLLTPCAAVP